MESRINLIFEGVPFKWDAMTIRLSSSEYLIVTWWTQVQNFEDVSKTKAMEDLESLKHNFNLLRERYPVLNYEDGAIELVVAFDDSGKLGIPLCVERSGHLEWYI
ncbi:hypothetical protein [Phaeocystidibacter luteus]|uniref:Uncharacterized protein n=1 Tax=Phaeocystidibacter luteus TaxID=911197 RepID=A0A6N6RKV6_9FLAO|nr:hypothetical protein [Phaeocystidibacter luteus]KAB2813949.1 hypothetical protein F8C67_04490 [Phaeocystidibacter luteus]